MLQRRAIVFALGALVTRELQGATEEFSASAVRVPKPTRRFTVDLDEAPRDRWRKVYSDPLFANATAEIQEYFDTVVPIKQAVPILETIAGDVFITAMCGFLRAQAFFQRVEAASRKSNFFSM